MGKAKVDPRAILGGDVLRECLDAIDQVVDGSGYAFTRLRAVAKELTHISETMRQFVHLRFIDISENNIADLSPLADLPSVLGFNACSNKVCRVECFAEGDRLPYCQRLDLSDNEIERVVPFGLPRLWELNLSKNKIRSFDDIQQGQSLLKTLRLSSNQICYCSGIHTLDNLQSLYLDGNQIESFEGIGELPSLLFLDASQNRIKHLDECEKMPGLATLLLRNNAIAGLEEIQKLQELPRLRCLDMTGCPLVEEIGADLLRMEILLRLPRLTSVNGEGVTEEDYESVQELREEKERQAEEEKLRQLDEDEQARRRKQEEEESN